VSTPADKPQSKLGVSTGPCLIKAALCAAASARRVLAALQDATRNHFGQIEATSNESVLGRLDAAHTG
jgi:hypothetical protein